MYAYAANNPVRYIDPDGRDISIGRWLLRNSDELGGMLFDGIEIATGIAGVEATFGISATMIFKGGSDFATKFTKVVITTYIAETQGDDKADYIDSLFPNSALGAVFYGLACIVSEIEGYGYKEEQFKKMWGSIGDALDMGIGLGLSLGMNKDISALLNKDPQLLTKLQRVLKLNKENVIATVGESTYQLLFNWLQINSTANAVMDYYY